MDLQNTINQRIGEIVNMSGKNVRAYSVYAGIPYNTMRDSLIPGRNVGYAFLRSIIDAEPDLNIEWLMTGKGEMYKSTAEKLQYSTEEEKMSESADHAPDYTSDIATKYISSLEDQVRELKEELREKREMINAFMSGSITMVSPPRKEESSGKCG